MLSQIPSRQIPKFEPIRHQQFEYENATRFRLHSDFDNDLHPCGIDYYCENIGQLHGDPSGAEWGGRPLNGSASFRHQHCGFPVPQTPRRLPHLSVRQRYCLQRILPVSVTLPFLL